MWFLILLFFCMPVYAENSGSLHIYAGSSEPEGYASWKTKIHVLVTDPLGRQIGHNPLIPMTFSDPSRGSGYSVESIDDAESNSPGPESIELVIMQATGGEYGIAVFGIDNAKYSMEIRGRRSTGRQKDIQTFSSYITSGTTNLYNMHFDPTPGAPAPVITKTVTFDTLGQDLQIAQKLNQLGDDKFVDSLINMVNLAEKLAGKCDKQKKAKKCKPAIAVLNMVIKRLETANRKCDSKTSKACDEDKDWNDFGKEHRKDHDYDDFFNEWDKDGWHKHKKTCKRFVSDEAFKIIKEDAQWLIKSLGSNQESGKAEGKH